MRNSKNRLSLAVACYVVIATGLFCFRASAQHPTTQANQESISDELAILYQQVKELKDPTFRAFLRLRLSSWEASQTDPARRQAAISVAVQGINDLCDHQHELWSPNAAWLHGGFLKLLKALQPPDVSIEACELKAETEGKSTYDFSAAIAMLDNPETSSAGVELAKLAIQTRQIPPDMLLAELMHVKSTKPQHLPPLLSAVVSLEEQYPGTLPLRILPFFSPVFLEKALPPEILTRYLSVAVRASRLSAAELDKPFVRGSVTHLLSGLIVPSQQFAPALYPEIAARLGSLKSKSPNMTAVRLAAEERIREASDPLDQLIAEANSTSDRTFKSDLFYRAARLAKERGQLAKAVDLATNVETISTRASSADAPSSLNYFLVEIVSLALKQKAPRDANAALSRIAHPLAKAHAFRLVGDYYGEINEKVESEEAFNQAAKLVRSVDNSNEKAKACLSIAESLVRYEPAKAFEAFRESVQAINNLPLPEKGQEKTYYLKLLPFGDDLIRTFSLLATFEHQSAIALAGEIKSAELRLAALMGVYRRR